MSQPTRSSSSSSTSANAGRSLRVRDCLSNTKPIFISPEAPLTDAMNKYRDRNTGLLIVSRDNKTVDGVLSDRDVTLTLSEKFAHYENLKVSDAMLCSNEGGTIVVANDNDNLYDIANKMKLHHVRRVPVVSGTDSTAIGVLSVTDIAAKDPELAGNILAAVKPTVTESTGSTSSSTTSA